MRIYALYEDLGQAIKNCAQLCTLASVRYCVRSLHCGNALSTNYLSTASRLRRLGWFAAISFLLLLSIPTANLLVIRPLQEGTLLFYQMKDGPLRVADFVPFYYAAKAGTSEVRLQSYDYDVRMKLSNELVSPHRVGEPFYCGYLPIVFVLMAPLAPFGLVSGYYIWCIASLIFGVGMLGIWLRRETTASWRLALTFCLLALWSLPSVLCFRLGQVSWLLVAAYVAFFIGLFRSKDLLPAIMLALSTVKPQYTAVIMCSALGLRRFRLLLLAIGIELALFALATVQIGWSNILRYPSLLHHTEFSDGAATVMVSIRSYLYAVAGSDVGLKINFVLLVLAMIALTILWRQAVTYDRFTQRWLAALTVVTALVVSPHTHVHDDLLLALAAALTLKIPTERPITINKWLSSAWYGLICTFAFLGYYFYSWPSIGHMSRWPLLVINLLIWMVGIVIYVSLVRRKTPANAEE